MLIGADCKRFFWGYDIFRHDDYKFDNITVAKCTVQLYNNEELVIKSFLT